jgi:hypothetical protein
MFHMSLSVTVIFVLLPPLILLLYPTKLFRKFLNCCGFRRLDILHLVMDVFQGWYKDGTEGTYDYRPLSAMYMILKMIICFSYFSYFSHFKLLISKKISPIWRDGWTTLCITGDDVSYCQAIQSKLDESQ